MRSCSARAPGIAVIAWTGNNTVTVGDDAVDLLGRAGARLIRKCLVRSHIGGSSTRKQGFLAHHEQCLLDARVDA